MSERFIVKNGTVTDITTGLMWQQESAGPMPWKEAKAYCEDLSLGGYDDWRPPEIEELFFLADRSKYNPAIDIIAFPGTMSSFYWSSTADAYDTGVAWGVDFGSGGVYSVDRSSAYYVRAVRGGQSGSFGDLVISEKLDKIAKNIAEIQAILKGGQS